MTVEQLEKFLHFFGKDNYVVLVLKANIDNIGDFTYKYLTTKYRDVIVKLIVSKNKGVYRPTEFPRENQKDNAFAIKVKDWNEKIIPTEVLFKHTIEDRINKKVKKTDYLRKSEKNTSLENVKDIIEKYLLSEASTEVMESVVPILKVIDKITLQKEIKKLSYNEFLKTAYWAHTRYEKLQKVGFRCQLCGAKTKTPNIHHNTYLHHGREMEYLEDLIVLCPECHKKFHNK